MTKEKRENIRAAAWLNLFIGIYNLYLYVNGGVWVFYRKI